MSPRPKKKRHCQGPFCTKTFKPAGTPLRELSKVYLYHDELEALRLCDYEGLFQEQAGEQMGVSRGTVQRTLTSARKKIAQALSTGSAIVFAVEGEKQVEEDLS
jgi:predicted DNA-binding protein (UPF0251 family)